MYNLRITNIKSIVCLIISSVMMLFVASVANAADEIVIGQVAPLTGTIAATGDEYVAGGKAYFDSVNQRGGIYGRKIRLVVKDDNYKADQTLAVTKSLLADEKPLALFGFVGTANVLALNKNRILEEAGIPLIAPYTGSQDLRDPINPNLFHIRASYTDETASMVAQMHTVGLRKFAVMYQDDGFGKSGLAGAESALQKLGLKAVATGSYDRAKPEEIDAAVNAIKDSNPDAIIMIAVNRASAAFVKKMRASGSKARLFSISVVNFKELIKNAGEENVLGMGIAQVMPSPYSVSLPISREFQAAMKKYQPTKIVSYASMESFIGAKILVEAIKRTGADPTRQKVISQLNKMDSYDLGGFRVKFSPESHVGSRFVEVTVIGRDGRLIR
jgi:branched-chain amino acid transport system substrate-binding protein